MSRFIITFLCIISILLCILFYALGVATGVSASVDDFKETVTFLSMLGGWVSGLGALAAVGATLWLAERQRREDSESLKIRISNVLVSGYRGDFLAIDVVSNGKRPCVVRTISFECPTARNSLNVTTVIPDSSPLPQPLNYGEGATFILPYFFIGEIAGFINKHCNGRAVSIYVVVSSHLESFKASVSPEMLENFNAQAEKVRLSHEQGA